MTRLIDFIKNNLAQLIRYGFVGGLVYGIEYALYLLFIYQCAVMPIYANATAKVAAGVIAYFLHRKLTFRKKTSADLHSDFVKYAACLLINIPLFGIIFYLVSLVGMNIILTKVLADVICIMVAYIQTKYLVFRAY